MKRVLLIMCLTLGLSQVSSAQIQFGVKAGINYNDNGDLKLSNVVSNTVEGADAKSGFHAGVWFRGKLPIIGLYLRPEIVYTQVKSEYLYKGFSASYDFKKIDVPVLLGKKFFGVVNLFVGPSFQYVLSTDFGLNTVNEVSLDKFSLGLQSGFGLEFGKLGVDVRWERGLSSSEASFADGVGNFTIDNRTNQIILGVSYRL
jgi:hypothetical protein